VILVAEDEALIMMNIVDDLIEAGYDVLEARHAEEALNILGAVADGIHILFTDVRMPGEMDGIALCHHTKKHWPWIGLLATTAAVSEQTFDWILFAIVGIPFILGFVVLFTEGRGQLPSNRSEPGRSYPPSTNI
jgi:CheY-like chemotaxis protein